MPTYIFKNKDNGEITEIQMRISDLDNFKASNPNLSQIPTAPNFRLKGTGWYETDFKTGKKKNISSNESLNNDKSTKTSQSNPKKGPKQDKIKD